MSDGDAEHDDRGRSRSDMPTIRLSLRIPAIQRSASSSTWKTLTASNFSIAPGQCRGPSSYRLPVQTSRA